MRPMCVICSGTSDLNLRNREEFEVDSGKAIWIVRLEPWLRGLNLETARLVLRRGDEGPLWRAFLNPISDFERRI